MRTSLAVAAAALALFSAPIASAAEAPAETTVDTATENTESTGFTFYKSFAANSPTTSVAPPAPALVVRLNCSHEHSGFPR
ncbi:hypothetical protein [Corynebacterium hiratae]|uniref:hypothetical protein n=1 Tax=Corynebacterium hiratae TaxID=3139423 RepID=UPI001E57BA91|nr:hypothetical protein [Corynebacterium aurimucosum]